MIITLMYTSISMVIIITTEVLTSKNIINKFILGINLQQHH